MSTEDTYRVAQPAIPTIIEPAVDRHRGSGYDPEHSARRDAIRAMKLHYGQWGRVKVGKDRWYWAADFWVHLIDDQQIIDGYSDTEEGAIADAAAAINCFFPEGYHVVFRANVAAGIYKKRHAKRTKFTEGWRDKFPFWKDRAYLYTTSFSDYDCHYLVSRHLIASVTDKFVFVFEQSGYGGPDILNPDRVTRGNCFALDRKELETEGSAYNREKFACFNVEEPHSENIASEFADNVAHVKELRAKMQKAHPDKGGDHDEFVALKKQYEAAKRGMREDV